MPARASAEPRDDEGDPDGERIVPADRGRHAALRWVRHTGRSSSGTWTNGITIASAAASRNSVRAPSDHQRQREEEQDRVRREDDIHRDGRGDQPDPDEPEHTGAHSQPSAGDPHLRRRQRSRPPGDQADGHSREGGEEDGRATVDHGHPRRRVRDVEVVDPQQVSRDHADDGEAPSQVDTGHTRRVVQPAPSPGEPPRTPLDGGGPRYCWRSSHTSSAFCACSRFSASSHTTLCGPSITSASTS